MNKTNYLDCTLRDGAHVVGARFQYPRITDVVSKLTQANADIVEFGFLKQIDNYDKDTINYPRIEDAYAVLQDVKSRENLAHKPMYALMARADEYDIHRLTPCTGEIELIRVAFYYDFLDGGIAFAKRAAELGYKCSLNLINTPGNPMSDLETFIEKANEIEPFAISIVDTFGVLTSDELSRILGMYIEKLNHKTIIGLHVHENLSLSMSLAKYFLETMNSADREAIVDGSLMGIGRAPGNLCAELIANHLNELYGKCIDLNMVMRAIEQDIKPLKKDYKWGYAPEFFLSAKYRVHRSYAEYLEGIGMGLDEIDKILQSIDQEHSEKYNKDYLLGLLKKIYILKGE